MTTPNRDAAGRLAPTHGAFSVLDKGGRSVVLDEVGRLSYNELREQLRDPHARDELKLELLTRLTVMMRIGFGEAERLAAGDHSIWDSPLIKRFATYLALLTRVLDSMPATGSEEYLAGLSAVELVDFIGEGDSGATAT